MKSIIKTFSLITVSIFLTWTFGGPQGIRQVEAVGNGFFYSRSITIDRTKVPNTDQTNFPVLFGGTYNGEGGRADLRTVANGGKVQNANGYDVGFYTNSDCSDKMAWETETYKAATGEVNYWVRVPTVSSSVDTVFYICYGNSSISSDQSQATSVWDSNFKGVWHFPDGVTLGALDSTSNGNNGTISGATATTSPTKINGGAGFDGNDSINLGSAANIDNIFSAGNYTGTVSFWGMARNSGTTMTFVGKDAGNATAWWIVNFGGKVRFRYSFTTTDGIWDSASVVSGTLYHVALTYTGNSTSNDPVFYINGVALTTENTAPSGTADLDETRDLMVGATQSVGSPLNGTVDELKVSNIIRSADWIATEYNNQNIPDKSAGAGGFYTVGAERSGANRGFMRLLNGFNTIRGVFIRIGK